jgi:glycogen(starch) synthase
MRVLLWSELFWPYIGGAEIMGAALIRALRPRGVEFAVVTSHAWQRLPDRASFHGVPVYRFPFRAALERGDLDLLFGLRRTVQELERELSPDLVHVNCVAASVLFYLDARNRIAPALFTVQQQLLPHQLDGRGTLLGRALRAADWVTAVSAGALAGVRRLVPDIERRSSLVYNGVERPAEDPAPLAVDSPCVLCLGRLVPAKGFDLALEAFARVCGRFPRVTLKIAGDGSERDRLEEQTRRLGLRERVEFLGWIAPADVPGVINRACVVLMPSRLEGLPVVGVQAALMGRPIVAARVGGLPEVVVHGETGLVVEAEDAPGLAEALAFVLANPAVAATWGQAARRRALEVFDWPRLVDAYEDLYRQLAASPARQTQV